MSASTLIPCAAMPARPPLRAFFPAFVMMVAIPEPASGRPTSSQTAGWEADAGGWWKMNARGLEP
eukprot:CAMPEP_0179242206 /NCGR_PEP_ID=MMETSP0797-20121207/16897_1 /TAXON_ID=47934 /ORGANISM="Dinophysis acuminata, Strain DAEP01" /LENGTH=64 /DNA_ID=CAMNT_0020949633 /DNA_START=37 /DNA_END=228 /DNA_ORIENTATION=-